MKKIAICSMLFLTSLFSNELEVKIWNSHKSVEKDLTGKVNITVYNRIKDNILAIDQGKFEKALVKEVCSKPEEKKVIESGIPFLFIYVYKSGTINILVDSCK